MKNIADQKYLLNNQYKNTDNLQTRINFIINKLQPRMDFFDGYLINANLRKIYLFLKLVADQENFGLKIKIEYLLLNVL